MNTEAPLTRGNEPSPTTLRMIRATGHVLLISSLALMVGLSWYQPDPYVKIWSVIVTHVFSGHPGNALMGLKLGFSKGFLFFQTSLQDIIMVCLIFPWLVKGFKHVAHVPYVGKTLADMHNFAMRHHKKIKPYGVLGLMVFVFIPLLSTGPIVGTFVGYLIGMSTLANFSAVLLANTLCAYTWVYAYSWLNEKNAEVTWWLLGFLIAAVVGGILYKAASNWLKGKRYAELVARRRQKSRDRAARRHAARGGAPLPSKSD